MLETDLEREAIAAAVAEADLRVVLMCLFQLTGDRRWLEPPYTPVRDVQLVSHLDAGLPPEVGERIRSAMMELLQSGACRREDAAVPSPDGELFRTMMSVCLGEDVPVEYVPMMRAELGFESTDPRWDTRPTTVPEVVIVGAGLSGIALGAHLSRLQIPYRIIEKNEEVGGTWWENRYPGAGVDTPNHAYSFSNGPRQHWSRFFALRDEIQSYIVKCADEFGVRSNISFGRTVISATWDDNTSLWSVVTRDQHGDVDAITARVIVSAVGVLNTPQIPPIPGLESFSGRTFHSAKWPDDANLEGARVGVVGTGATAMQLVPALADTARSLTVFQRSPQWVRPVPGYRDEMPPATTVLLDRVPFYQEWLRFSMFWRYGDGLLKTLRRDPTWPHPERSINLRNDRHREELTAFIKSELADRPDLQETCIPSYPPFAKRILIDNGWYQALKKESVELVPDAVERIDGSTVVARDGTRRDLDVLIFATGFDVSRLAAGLNVRGRNGVSLADVWSDANPTAYLGMTVPGFPNMFSLLGPNSALGHGGSTIFQSECQARYIAQCIIELAKHDSQSMEVRPAVHDAFVEAVDREHASLVWTHPGVTNWYRNEKGRVTVIMPWRLVDFWHMTQQPDFADFTFDVAQDKSPCSSVLDYTTSRSGVSR